MKWKKTVLLTPIILVGLLIGLWLLFGGTGLPELSIVSPRIYYRWQVLKILAITPDVQLLINPALNPNEDVIGVFSIRGRISL